MIDPIDGTKNFLRGVPVWATLIALMVDDEVVAGVVSAPALGRRWWAARGTGAWTGKAWPRPRRMPCLDGRLPRAGLAVVLLAGRLGGVGRLEAFLDLMRDVLAHPRIRRLLVLHAASPRARSTSPPSPSSPCTTWPRPAVIVEEAGGRFTDLDGKPGPLGGNALATNGLLHDEVLAIIG